MGDGTLHKGQPAIKSTTVKFFKPFFEQNPTTNLQSSVLVATLFDTQYRMDDTLSLEKPCTLQEISSALKSFSKDKSPGPDGWTVEFYLHFFDLIGQDLLELVEDNRLRGKVIGAINSTFLTLIPKTDSPTTFGDFRPISLCNLCYKLISKIIANRIKPILSRFISNEQLGFLKGRQIIDAIGTAQECLHSIKSKKSKALILKLDLKKAFDCIDWDFLRLILVKTGFSQQTIKWIMSCITSANLTILVNGEASTFFRMGRGLRQGFPLSPLLFTLAMEALSLLLKSAYSEGKISGIKISRTIKILHLLFVDDVLILSKGTLQDWIEIKEILHLFCIATGLTINWDKSSFHFANIPCTTLDQIKDIFPFTFVPLTTGLNYLGYHLKPDSYKPSDWNWLLIKVENRIGHWCSKWLSLGGRFTLLKVVLEGQAVYWMALAAIPASVLTKLCKMMFNFLWSGCSDHPRQHLCSWKTLAKPKKRGAGGFTIHSYSAKPWQPLLSGVP
jgi:hypothetical protein